MTTRDSSLHQSVKESNAYVSKSSPLLLPGLREQESAQQQARQHHQRQPGDPRDAHVKPISQSLPSYKSGGATL